MSGKMLLASHAPTANRTARGAGVGSWSNGERMVEPRGGRSGTLPAGRAVESRGGRGGGPVPVVAAI